MSETDDDAFQGRDGGHHEGSLGNEVVVEVTAESAGELAGQAAEAGLLAAGVAIGPLGVVVAPLVGKAVLGVLGPSPATRRMAAADAQATRDATLHVPRLDRVQQQHEQRLARLEGLAPTIEAALAELKTSFAGPPLEFVHEVVLEVDRLGLPWAQLPPEFHEALRVNFRRSLDTIDPSVLPSLARLTVVFRDKPLDRNFRNVARLLVDLDAGEFADLRVLVASARRADLDWRHIPGHSGEFALTLVAEYVTRGDAEGVAWARPNPEPAHAIVARWGVVAALLRTGVAVAPTPESQPVAYDTGTGVDRRLLELHGRVLDLLETIVS